MADIVSHLTAEIILVVTALDISPHLPTPTSWDFGPRLITKVTLDVKLIYDRNPVRSDTLLTSNNMSSIFGLVVGEVKQGGLPAFTQHINTNTRLTV